MTEKDDAQCTDNLLNKLPSRPKCENDVDALAEQFDKWQQVLLNLLKQKTKLLNEVEAMKADKVKQQEHNDKLEKDLSALNDSVTGLHNQVHLLFNHEDDNRKLQTEILEKDRQLKNMNEDMVHLEEKNSRLLISIKDENEDRRHHMREDMKKQADLHAELLNADINEKQQHIDALKNDVVTLQKEKSSELMKLSMEYEGKLNKLQRQKVQVPQQSSSNQEIFRKKLQHMKTEYEMEISKLKQTFHDIQHQVHEKSQERANLGNGKKRRF